MAKSTKSLGKICKVLVISVNAVFLTSIGSAVISASRLSTVGGVPGMVGGSGSLKGGRGLGGSPRNGVE